MGLPVRHILDPTFQRPGSSRRQHRTIFGNVAGWNGRADGNVLEFQGGAAGGAAVGGVEYGQSGFEAED